MHRLCNILLFLLPMISVGQNLVPNPSFEEYDDCPNSSGQVWKVENWVGIKGSIDYFNTCGQNGYGVPENTVGFQNPQDGSSYIGLAPWAYGINNAREFVGANLVEPLEVGKRYRFEMFVSLADTVGYAIHEFGASFTSNQPNNNLNSLFNIGNRIALFDSVYFDLQQAWTSLKGSYIADGTESFVTIGNFLPDTETDTIRISLSGTGSSYYYIDAVSLIEDTTYHVGIQEPEFTFSIYPNPATTNLTIESRTPLAQVWVRDVAGRAVLPTLRLGSGYGNIDVTSLPSGIYLVEVLTQNGQRSVQKVVVE